MKRQMIMLRGLSCPNCAAKLEKAAKALPGMKSASVAFGSGSLSVEYDSAVLGEERIREIIAQLGLEVASTMNRPGGL